MEFGQAGYDGVITAFANSIDFAFLAGGVIMFMLVFVGWFIRPKSNKMLETEEEGHPEQAVSE
jgi:ABC-type Fe3+ transport system permease subunit